MFSDLVIGPIRDHGGYIPCILDTSNNRHWDLITNQKASAVYINYYQAFARNSHRFLTNPPVGVANPVMEGPAERTGRATLVGASVGWSRGEI